MDYNKYMKSKNKAQETLNDAALQAADVIAHAAAGAVETIKSAAAEALKTVNIKNSNGLSDHDLVQRIDTKVDGIIATIAKLENAQTIYVTQTQHAELVKTTGDHETRVRILEESRWKVVGATGVVTGLLSVLGTYIVQTLTH